MSRLVEYFILLGLSLNISKRKVMTFCIKRCPMIHSYNLMGCILLSEYNDRH